MAKKEKKEMIVVKNKFIEKVNIGGIDYIKCAGLKKGLPEVFFPCSISTQDKKGVVSVEKWFIDAQV